MIVTIYTPAKAKKSGVFFDVLYKPHECWNGELYRVILPRNNDLESLLKDVINIYHVQLHDGDKILYLPDAWVTVDKTHIMIDYDSHYYGVREQFDEKILEYKR